MTENELRRRFPIGTRVKETKGNQGLPSPLTYKVVGHHRGAVVLEDPKYGTTHHVKAENVRKVGGPATRRQAIEEARQRRRAAMFR